MGSCINVIAMLFIYTAGIHKFEIMTQPLDRMTLSLYQEAEGKHLDNAPIQLFEGIILTKQSIALIAIGLMATIASQLH